MARSKPFLVLGLTRNSCHGDTFGAIKTSGHDFQRSPHSLPGRHSVFLPAPRHCCNFDRSNARVFESRFLIFRVPRLLSRVFDSIEDPPPFPREKLLEELKTFKNCNSVPYCFFCFKIFQNLPLPNEVFGTGKKIFTSNPGYDKLIDTIKLTISCLLEREQRFKKMLFKRIIRREERRGGEWYESAYRFEFSLARRQRVIFQI